MTASAAYRISTNRLIGDWRVPIKYGIDFIRWYHEDLAQIAIDAGIPGPPEDAEEGRFYAMQNIKIWNNTHFFKCYLHDLPDFHSKINAFSAVESHNAWMRLCPSRIGWKKINTAADLVRTIVELTDTDNLQISYGANYAGHVIIEFAEVNEMPEFYIEIGEK